MPVKRNVNTFRQHRAFTRNCACSRRARFDASTRNKRACVHLRRTLNLNISIYGVDVATEKKKNPSDNRAAQRTSARGERESGALPRRATDKRCRAQFARTLSRTTNDAPFTVSSDILGLPINLFCYKFSAQPRSNTVVSNKLICCTVPQLEACYLFRTTR